MNQATNSAVMRESNRKLILNMIRRQPISRAEIAQRTNLTRASVTQIMDELLNSQLVEECNSLPGDISSHPGRRPTLLTIKPNSRFIFGVHITRHMCTVGVTDLCGNIITEQKFTIDGLTPDKTADVIASIINQLQKELNIQRETIIGIGISTPGPLDYRSGVILNPPNFDQWHNTPICSMLIDRTDLPSLLEKDTNARALEEMYYGEAKNISGFMLVHIDEGVGSGVVIHDALYRGTHGMGTEIGHTSICYDGPPCSCGGRGCLEIYLRIPSLLHGTGFDNWQQLAASGSRSAEAILDKVSEYLAAALINAFNSFDLEKVILTGDVASAPQPLLDRLNPIVTSRILSRSSIHSTPITASNISASVRTGAMAMLYDFFQDRR